MIKNITQLRNLIALAEAGSFTHAARAVNRSQPAFSHSIAELERDLGVRLIDRAGHSNDFTFMGRAVLAHARQVVFEADELMSCVTHHVQGRAGHFRLGIGPTPAAMLVVPLLRHAAASAMAPKITISVGLTEPMLEALKERRLDFLVVEMRSVIPVSELAIEHLATLKTGVLVRPGHPLLQQAEPVALTDFKQYPVASTPVTDDVTRLMVNAYGPAAHPSELVTLCCDDIGALLETCAQTDALFLGVVKTASNYLEQGRLVVLPFDTSGLEFQFALVRLARQVDPPAFGPLRQLIVQQLQNL